jgi:hypothetical protein
LEPREYGLAPPQLTIALTSGDDSSPKTLLVGGEKTQEKGVKQLYIKRGEKETLFLVGDWVLRDLNKSVDDFRDKTIAKFAQDEAAKIEVKRQDGQGFVLTKGADQKWSIDKSGEGVFKDATVTQLISTLADLRGFEIAADNPTDLGAYGLASPALSIVVFGGKDEKLASVFMTQKSEADVKKVFAMKEGEKIVFALRDYMFDRLNKAPADFWENPTEKEASGVSSASPPPALEHEGHEHEEDLPAEEESD